MAESTTSPEPSKTFAQLTLSDKLKFIGKAVLFFVSGGFVFPTLWVD